MKILYVTDLHGNKWKYNQLFDIAKKYKVDAVINGGDMLPKNEGLSGQNSFLITWLNRYFKEFNDSKIYYLSCLGNDDLKIFDTDFDLICNKYPYIKNLAQRKVNIGNFEFIGMNWVVDYPFRLKDRCRKDTKDYVFQKQLGTGLLSSFKHLGGYDEIKDWVTYANTLPTIEDELNKLPKSLNQAQSIYVIHMPPYRLGLDVCDTNREVGSKAVYDFIKKQQSLLSLHGHIHESPKYSGKWFNKIGNTVCIQPGQSKALTYVIIDLENVTFQRFFKCPI